MTTSSSSGGGGGGGSDSGAKPPLVLPSKPSNVGYVLPSKPSNIIKETVKNTTQMAVNTMRIPMRQHFKSRFPAMNVRRLSEVVATDMFFSSVKALGGEKCAQLYVGKKSYLTRFYPMTHEEQMSDAFLDFIREIGAPTALMCDNAKAQTTQKYCIADMQTELMHPNQNVIAE